MDLPIPVVSYVNSNIQQHINDIRRQVFRPNVGACAPLEIDGAFMSRRRWRRRRGRPRRRRRLFLFRNVDPARLSAKCIRPSSLPLCPFIAFLSSPSSTPLIPVSAAQGQSVQNICTPRQAGEGIEREREEARRAWRAALQLPAKRGRTFILGYYFSILSLRAIKIVNRNQHYIGESSISLEGFVSTSRQSATCVTYDNTITNDNSMRRENM